MTLKYLPWQQYSLVKLLGLCSVVWPREREDALLCWIQLKPNQYFPCLARCTAVISSATSQHFVVQKHDLVTQVLSLLVTANKSFRLSSPSFSSPASPWPRSTHLLLRPGCHAAICAKARGGKAAGGQSDLRAQTVCARKKDICVTSAA